MSDPFVTLSAIAAPLPWSDVNTDTIFPAAQSSPVLSRRGGGVVALDRARMGENAFAAHRYEADGTLRPDFVLNQPPFDRAQILITGANFGCGSSRESAVWALVGIGIRCVIAPSFGDIFYGNCTKNGLLPALVPELVAADAGAIAAAHPDPVFRVDLVECAIHAPDGTTWPFQIGTYPRQLLLEGKEEIAATLERLSRIEEYETAYRSRRPWVGRR
jgi:3-isopropylmalate/(R)-2-methylmalate dehydratase small subunit